MILIGMFDSPYVRRVAISMKLLGIKFEHRNWSVGKDAELIRAYNPQARVPTLALDDGEVLIESAAILDHLDELAGPDRALLPERGDARRHALKLTALATSAVDKGIQSVYERVFRPQDRHHQPWVDRCNAQMHGAFTELEKACQGVAPGQWLMGARLSQPDITLTCVTTYLRDAADLALETYPAMLGLTQRCETMPAFGETYVPFLKPAVAG